MLPPLFLKDIPAHDKPHIEDDVESIGSDLGVRRELRNLKLDSNEREQVAYLNKDLPKGPPGALNDSQASGEWRREVYTQDKSKYKKGIVYVTKPARINERGQGFLEDGTLVITVNVNDDEYLKHNQNQSERAGLFFCGVFVCACILFLCVAIITPLAIVLSKPM